MEMKISQKGSNNVLVNGQENTILKDSNITLINNTIRCNPSTLYDLCKKLCEKIDFKEIEGLEYEMYNSDWIEKLEYNKIEKVYLNRFKEISLDLDTIEEVVNSLENQDSFIKWINLKYQKLCVKFPEKTKEQILVELNEELEKQLQITIKNDNIYTIEELSLNIDRILFYAFTKCKVLDPIMWHIVI